MNLLHSDYIILFLLTSIGVIVGKVKIKGISLDTSAIFFVALIFGYFGFTIPAIIQQIGLIFFMYSIGIQAGPGFFESFKKQGKSFLLLAIILSFSGGLLTVALSKIFNIDILLASGLFMGSLTSASSLAVTIENTQSILPSVGFGIAFPFGVIGVVLLTRLSPKIFGIDIKKEEEDHLNDIEMDYPKIFTKNFILENPNAFDKTIGELNLRSQTNTNISRVYQKYAMINPKASTVLRKGDFLRASGTKDDLKRLEQLIGKETNIKLPVNRKYTYKHFIVTNNKIINKPLGQLTLLQMLNITITTIRRSGIEITPNVNSKLRFGDRINVAGPEENMSKIKSYFGDEKSRLDELDFLPILLGILIGILIGLIKIPVSEKVSIGIGLTGGVLISAVILSRIGKTGTVIWNISGPSNQFLRKLGLIFFLSGVGLDAGSKVMSAISNNGFNLFIMAVLITIIPMMITIIIGKHVLKLNFLRLLGALTGSMTSTPALSAIEPLTKTNAPQVAYATIYPLALILIIIISQIIILF
ncbi:MAG: transporter [Marinilabiliales bacterium]|nr:MAG: transporter [Marinilabiliales bacterium]